MHIQLSDGCLVYANKRGTGLPTLFPTWRPWILERLF